MQRFPSIYLSACIKKSFSECQCFYKTFHTHAESFCNTDVKKPTVDVCLSVSASLRLPVSLFLSLRSRQVSSCSSPSKCPLHPGRKRRRRGLPRSVTNCPNIRLMSWLWAGLTPRFNTSQTENIRRIGTRESCLQDGLWFWECFPTYNDTTLYLYPCFVAGCFKKASASKKHLCFLLYKEKHNGLFPLLQTIKAEFDGL